MARRKSTKRRRTPTKRRRRSSSKRRRGTGSIITVRKSRRRGMGMLGGKNSQAILAPLIGGGVSLLTTLGVRYYVTPDTETKQKVVKWSWLVGHGAGVLSALALYALNRKDMTAALGAVTSATVVGLGFFANDWLTTQSDAAPRVMAALTAATSQAAGNGSGNGTGAIVMQQLEGGRRGTGAIVPEYSRGGMGSYGEEVALSGVNTSVFGTPGFSS